ncbi:MAG TPA: WcaI family glycosyltransferase [Methylomirabilota bacterium]|nr:WcaI family glycosyltransferase [Methylomirabilota bacterium]
MNIVVWGINYSPEVIGIAPFNTELCEFMAARGHIVDMVTTFAYYPAWRKLPTEQYSAYRTDNIEEVTVHRCWHYVSSKVTTVRRILHEFSFVFSSMLKLLALKRPDIVVVVSPPLLLGAAAWFYGLLRNVPFIFHVQDLQPDAAAGLGMLKKGLLVRGLYKLEAFAYRKAARVSGISRGMLDAFRAKGVPEQKLVYFPNGVHLPDMAFLPQAGLFRSVHGISSNEFLVVYSGNVGVKQGLDLLIRAAALVTHPRFRLVICGEGNQRDALSKLATELNLRNVLMLPVQSEQHYRELLRDADLCVIPQLTRSANFFFPSKLLTTLAFAKPVLTIADETSDLALATREGQFGKAIPPGEPALVARTIETLMNAPADLQRFSEAGRRFVEQFRFPEVLQRFEQELTACVQERA